MKLGQHFLLDPSVIERIVSFAGIKSDDRVLEIGPGTGFLTEALAARAGIVYAVEVDPDLAGALCGRAPNVQVINADALKVELPDYNKIVSNLPYQISSKIAYRLLSRPFELAVLMFQREFALRMMARPGSKEYGRLGMVAGFFCQIEILESVPRTAFRPVPEVDSSIVRLRPRMKKLEVDPEVFMRLAEALFRNRRKKVKKGLAAFGVGREIQTELDASLLEKRPEELAPDEVAGMAYAIKSLKNENIQNTKKEIN
jgi:16S rRNA (adenine1518-N6/adenine1519-N6)-dimethyltransferase